MPWQISIPIFLLAAAAALAQDAPQAAEQRYEAQYSVEAIDDATFYGGLREPLPSTMNQLLLEPSFSLRRRDRWNLSASLIGQAGSYADNFTRLRVRDIYTGLSAGDFDFTLGRKLTRWSTGYAFSPAGVLDPPRTPTDPTDRLNVNQGRDMVKADWVRGPHALSLVWSSAALAPAQAKLHDTTAFRYNVLVREFDTSLIAGDDRGGDAFGALTFTRVFGQAWETHGEAVWREHPALLLGAKCTVAGITFIGEFYTPPNIPYYRDTSISALAGRQHYVFLHVEKPRLRELPGWKQWDLAAYAVANLDDHGSTTVLDLSRWIGNHFSVYAHTEVPAGSHTSEYGSAPYSTATSVGVRFQL
jgi:hypothetical protein